MPPGLVSILFLFYNTKRFFLTILGPCSTVDSDFLSTYIKAMSIKLANFLDTTRPSSSLKEDFF